MTIKFRAKHKSGFWVDLPLTPFTFPAGEAHIKGFEDFKPEEYTKIVADIRGKHNPQDLFHLAELSQGISIAGSEAELHVFLPYLPAARSDRGLPTGADVYAAFLNRIVIPDSVIAIDPHSEYITTVIEDLKVYPFERIIKANIQDVESDTKPRPYDGVIAPDKGARDRAARAAKVMGVPVYTAGKTRDFETGKLTGFHMEDELPAEGRFLIVDDICDGGGTFLGLAEAIKKTNPDVVLDLWVTHGIFSQGFDSLRKTFKTIHTTNSYFAPTEKNRWWPQHAADAPVPKNVIVHDITPALYAEVHSDS